jgi:lipopolysaccharide/colanic/teichoic acid biosynthesis glycosyltransferase
LSVNSVTDMGTFAVAINQPSGQVDITSTRRKATPFNASADYGKALVVETPSSSAAVEALESILGAGWPALLDVTDRSTLGGWLGTVSDGSHRRYIEFHPFQRRGLADSLLRVRDILVAAPALVATAPLMALAALLIRMSEGKAAGPIFHRATVVGQYGAPFAWRKLRTMRLTTIEDSVRAEQFRAYVEGEPAGGAHTKIVDESRITRVGRFLRKHSVDELPQLWNVITGDMTLVGPRPMLEYEYALQSPWHRLRFQVRPGLTGIWQVCGRSRVPFEEMALMDYCYAHHRSLGLDFRLLAATALVVLNGRGGA